MKKLSILFLLTFATLSILTADRTKISINESWGFLKGNYALEEILGNEIQKDWERINIPHTWNAADSRDNDVYYYRGAGWYKKELRIPADLLLKDLFLHFEGAHQVKEVYLNGEFVGSHHSGYTAFRFKINEYLNKDNPAINELVVRVDNSHSDDIPPLGGDWTFFGGIYRDVYLVGTNPIHFDMNDYASDGVYVESQEVSRESAQIELTARITNNYANKKVVIVKTELIDKSNQVVSTNERKITIANGLNLKEIKLPAIEKPHLWSPQSPYLYDVVCSIEDPETGQILDRMIIPWGFRWYHFDAEKGFFLNGENIKLVGASRHQDFSHLGNALPDSLHERDMKLLKEMGGNFVRIAHYPQDKALMRACDRLGILACVEVPIVARITLSEAFFENSKYQMREMITQYRNHPSVIMWSYMNEVLLSTKLGKYEMGDELPEETELYLSEIKKLAKELEAIAFEMDPERYTMVSNVKWGDIHIKAGLTTIPEVVGWNLYSGWYGSDLEVMDNFLKEFHRDYPGIPIMMSEFGAGSDPRIRTDEPKRFDFSMEYQNLYNEHYLNAILNYDFVAGGAIWNFADFSSEPRQDAVPYINSKGVTTRTRAPKDSYYLYQSRLKVEPVLKIAPVLLDKLIGVEGSAENPIEREIRIYSNLPRVELFLNGKTLGYHDVGNGYASVLVEFNEGINFVKAVGNDGDREILDVQRYEFERIPYELGEYFASSQEIREIRVNLGAHFWYTDDTDLVWLKDQPYNSKNSFGYLGGEPFTTWRGARVGTHKNISQTTDDPLFQTQRVGIKSYRFDVPAGSYELALGFAELLSLKEYEALAFNLGADSDEKSEEANRIFSISLNGERILEDFNVAEEVGAELAFEKKLFVRVNENEGIQLDFEAISGEPILNTIRLKRIN